jgi:hypothetical protein
MPQDSCGSQPDSDAHAFTIQLTVTPAKHLLTTPAAEDFAQWVEDRLWLWEGVTVVSVKKGLLEAPPD